MDDRPKTTAAVIVLAIASSGGMAACAEGAPGPSVERSPRVTGTPQMGARLLARPGTWRGPGAIRYGYAWLRCDRAGAGCQEIEGAEEERYEAGAADVGARLRVVVRASNRRGSSTARSAPSRVVAVPRALGVSRGRTREIEAGESLDRAFAELTPGDTLLLGGGDYQRATELAASGTAERPITVTARPGERPVLRGRLKITGSYVRVSGLVLDGPTASLYVSHAHHVEFTRNEIRNVAVSGIYVGDDDGRGSDHVHITRNYVHDNGSRRNLDHGIYFGNGRHAVIADNVVERNHAMGIKLGPGALGSLTANNTVVSNGRSGIIVSGDDEDVSRGNRVVNNLLAANAHMGIRTYWESAGVGDDNLARGNLASGHPGGDFVSTFGGIAYRDNRSADPRFRTGASGDYALSPGSPAIDAGLARWSFGRDFAGRPRDGRPDVGAFESG